MKVNFIIKQIILAHLLCQKPTALLNSKGKEIMNEDLIRISKLEPYSKEYIKEHEEELRQNVVEIAKKYIDFSKFETNLEKFLKNE